MSKGDAEHAAQHKHGIQYAGEPQASLTLEQRVAKLEEVVTKLGGAALFVKNGLGSIDSEASKVRDLQARVTAIETQVGKPVIVPAVPVVPIPGTPVPVTTEIAVPAAASTGPGAQTSGEVEEEV